jgi:hypothetical protein
MGLHGDGGYGLWALFGGIWSYDMEMERIPYKYKNAFALYIYTYMKNDATRISSKSSTEPGTKNKK